MSGTCEAVNCSEFVPSGSISPTSVLGANDDLTIYSNGEPIFVNADGTATQMGPVGFGGAIGDQLRIVATDVDVFCRGLDAIYLHCPETGQYRLLTGAQLDGCGDGRFPGVFFDQTYTIGFA